MQIPKAVLFDLDETLSDRSAAIADYVGRLTERFGAQFTCREPEFVHRAFQAADGNGYRDKAEAFELFVRAVGWRNPPSADEYLSIWKSTIPECTRPMKRLLDMLGYFRQAGVPLGLITNGSSAVQNGKIERLGIRPYFRAILISGEVGIKKPDERIFQMALEALGAEPQEAWFIGDHPLNDVCGAKACGLQAVWLKGEHIWDGALPYSPDYTVSGLHELVDLHRMLEKRIG
ncbi:Pyrimidine 5'-nucleotidase YjjG [Paenibacillus konkukensis]|uniref:Pyrimidine 5'-nucleotidase YjjG n=2 Tax=Paenibacillus konkukensis TaxID=2020716 RepID=A0ABY4RHN9_9BACL|nr:Pyrimidine 5'-nucleotidase YjjG [Paenibacillus konkukensis]